MLKMLLWCSALLAAIAFAGAASAADEPTLHQVYQAADAGKLSEAQAMMQTVLRDHPNSAKAHFVEAELLAKEGHFSSAASELKTAERLEPGLPFANASAVDHLRRRIAGSRAATQSSPFTAAPSAMSSELRVSMLLMGIALVAALYFFVRATRRRMTQSLYPAGGSAYGAGTATPTQPFGPAGMGSGAAGMGSSMLGGLATGAALGAGMVAGESLMHRLTDRGRVPLEDASNTSMLGQPDWNTVPDDMGGGDFGIADDSSWDDSSSGGDWG
jgi:uncharacterized protein